MNFRPLTHITVVLLFAWACSTQAALEVRISSISYLDKQYMDQQRALLQDLSSRNLGQGFTGNRDRDLDLLQRLLDKRLVRAGQTRELQAMGIIMGDLLATELDMHWVIYEDRVGRSRALRYKETESFLFPVTMISRRREAGNETPVTQIYAKARDIIEQSRPALPFQ